MSPTNHRPASATSSRPACKWPVLAAFAAVLLALRAQHRALRQRRAQARCERNELARASRIALLGELSASIVHEIRQPLAAILANADAASLLLAQPAPPTDVLRQLIADIRASNQRANDVMHRLRALLERREVQCLEVDLLALLDDTVQLLAAEARRRRVDLVFEPGPGDVVVLGDRVQLQQLFLNLLINAMDAMRGTAPMARKVELTTHQRGDGQVEVRVSDRGHGLGSHAPATLFAPFFTTKAGGMGVGLSVARAILGAHHGSLHAAPRDGGGTVFTVRLPSRHGTRPAAGPLAAACPPPDHERPRA
ncbi:sensor histidine kinase [Eleftheria terrae]|uniref:sensor histidine kinase n=1 Tax=Eleftheria terrae TaxID=1597781 RepID=UPI00263B8E15|nr:ATP-binding protein [Eleftheria terrae]WKB55550.1 ATP-binding protein [Eleftheria terrae]